MIAPVTPNAAPAAADLLALLYRISGQVTLTGQHCTPLYGTTGLSAAEKWFGDYPALLGQDFGFGRRGSWDGTNFRQQVVDEAIRRHGQGYVNTICWHAAPPTAREPVVFEEAILGNVTEAEWDDLLTPGSDLHQRWCASVDVIAWFLRQLQEESVPVLWRPYHEMNGGWFWWGGDAPRFIRLYRMLFDRFTGFHGLTNLLWVWSPGDAANPTADPPVGPYADYYPGHDVVDVLACDIYRPGFDAGEHDALLALGEGRPIALGEVGEPPTLEQLRDQRRWCWFMYWWPPLLPAASEAATTTYGSDLTWNVGDLPGARPPFA